MPLLIPHKRWVLHVVTSLLLFVRVFIECIVHDRHPLDLRSPLSYTFLDHRTFLGFEPCELGSGTSHLTHPRLTRPDPICGPFCPLSYFTVLERLSRT